MTSTTPVPVTLPPTALETAADIAAAPTLREAAVLLANHVTAVAEAWGDATLTACTRYLTAAYAARVDELDRATRTYVALNVARKTGAVTR